MAQSLFEKIIEIVEGMDEIKKTFLAGNFEANLNASRIAEDDFPIAVVNNSLSVTNSIGVGGLITRRIPISIAFLMLEDDLDTRAIETQQKILNPMQEVADKCVGLILKSDLIDPTEVIDNYTTNSQVKIYDDWLSGAVLTMTIPEKTGKCILKTNNVI